MKKAVLFVIMLMMLCGCKSFIDTRQTVYGYALNTEIKISVDMKDIEKAREALNMCTRYDKLFSRTDEESEIYKINSGENIELSDETKEIIEKGLYFSEMSKGVFDISIEPLSSLWNFGTNTSKPDGLSIEKALEMVDYTKIEKDPINLNGRRIDLGAIAKGYIADKIREYFKQEGVSEAVIDLGGNIVLIGGEYKVGIQSPFESSKIYASLSIKDASIVTSGIYQRYFEEDGVFYHHILDTKSGMPIDNNLASVSVICKESTSADALATILFALGSEKGLEFIKDMEDVDAIFINKDGEYVASENFEEKYSLEVM